MLYQEAPIPIQCPERSNEPKSTMDGLEVGPDGGQINQETHIPFTEANYPIALARDSAAQNSTIGPGRGMLDLETHIPIATQAEPQAGVGPDGGMLDQETHIPIATQAEPQAGVGPDGGMVDQETHIPVTRQNTFSSADFPASPGRDTVAEDSSDEDSPSRVYFVCQRGNDSQLAAVKLMESVQAEEAATEENKARQRKWAWIGDVKGGFLAMERHATM